MRSQLARHFRLRPGIHWCHKGGCRIRVTLQRCAQCPEAAEGCEQYDQALSKSKRSNRRGQR